MKDSHHEADLTFTSASPTAARSWEDGLPRALLPIDSGIDGCGCALEKALLDTLFAPAGRSGALPRRPRGALGVNAISFLLSASALFGLPPLRAPVTDASPGFLASGTGLVSAAFGVGMIGVSVGLSWRSLPVALSTLLIVAWVASGVRTVATGLAPLVALVAVGQAVSGLGNGLENIAADTLIQRAVPPEILGRAFGVVSTAVMGGSTVAYAAGGLLLDLTSPRAMFLIRGVGTLVVSAFLWSVLRGGLAEGFTGQDGRP